MARILDGKWLSEVTQAELAHAVAEYQQMGKRPPGLGVILVGDNPASLSYVGNKERIAKKVGFATFDIRLPATAVEADVSRAIMEFNLLNEVDGILLQLPLPSHLKANPLIDKIDPLKDADGLHPFNQGLLVRGEGTARPCTPLGVMRLIDLAYSAAGPGVPSTVIPEANLTGKHAVVIGRSILVGKPVSMLLLERNATVTVAHSKTRNIQDVVKGADIVVAAVGSPKLVKGDWIREGAIVIDVGINRVEGAGLVGDVDFAAAEPRASAITPVPGGVGPMTIAMLLLNTLNNYRKRLSL